MKPFCYPDTAIQVFCKAPVPGRVKTRLMPKYSANQAAAIHRILTESLLRQLQHYHLCPIQLWCSPHTDFNFFSYCMRKYHVSLFSQSGPDLGARMHHSFSTSLKNYRQVLLVGCDCPVFERGHFIDSIESLKSGRDLVIGPAEDGGYVLIGLDRTQPELFQDIQWGGTSVLSETLRKAKLASLRYSLLPELWDIDRPEDFKKTGLNPISF